MSLTWHYRIAAALLAIAGIVAFAGCLMIGLLMGAFACDHPPNGDTTICIVVGGGFFLIGSVGLVLPPLWAAVGLWVRRANSRRLVLICSGVMCVLLIPIGTVAGGYILHLMLKRDPQGRYFQTRVTGSV